MLRDVVRNEAYRKSLEAWIRPESVILDMGAGSGILSIFAAQYGAQKIYAVERSSIARIAKELIQANGLGDRIEVLNTDMENVELPQKVDLIVSDWLGPIGVDENFLPALLIARDRWLKPDGKILPHEVTAWIAPVWDPNLDSDLLFWRSRPFGVDLSRIAIHTADEIRYQQDHILPQNLVSAPALLWTTNMYDCSTEEARQPFRSSVEIDLAEEVQINALALWFTALFPEGTQLSCGPEAPDTHWGRTVCPLEKILSISGGSRIRVDFECKPWSQPGVSSSRWSVYCNGVLCETHSSSDGVY